MPFFIFCFFIIAIICLIQGFRKSSFDLVGGSKQHCAICGWTKEKVQACQFEQHHQTMTASLCFDCSIKHDALPIRDSSIATVVLQKIKPIKTNRVIMSKMSFTE